VITPARHVEIQVLCDDHGPRPLTCGERECSVQRPPPEADRGVAVARARRRAPRGDGSRRRAARGKHIGYRKCGHVSSSSSGRTGSFSFIELKRAAPGRASGPRRRSSGSTSFASQVRIAAGDALRPRRPPPALGGAMRSSCGSTAEDPARGVRPRAPGRIERFPPAASGPGVRVDTFRRGRDGHPRRTYDSLIAKVVVFDGNRRLAIRRARRALSELEVEGVPTTRGRGCRTILASEEFQSGEYSHVLPRGRPGARLPALAGT